MKEELLYHLWRYKRFNMNGLSTTCGQPILLINAGTLNHHSGPDFSNARLRIDRLHWAGNVEIHVKSSDWFKHNHQVDKAYSNIILHVVWEDDCQFFEKTSIPTLELKNRVSRLVLEKYSALQNIQEVPCAEYFMQVEEVHVLSWLERLMIERLQQKTARILSRLEFYKGNWEEVYFEMLFASFGFKVNQLPFELLAQSIRKNILRKHENQLLQLEALLFGMAGFLHQPKDNYQEQLAKEFSFLKAKYQLKEVECTWKFGKMRPANFPTIRIAQLAFLLQNCQQLVPNLLGNNQSTLFSIFSNVATSSYWENHYRWGKESVYSQKMLGSGSYQNIRVNVHAPFLYAYGTLMQVEKYIDFALNILRECSAEKNRITEKYAQLGLKCTSAFQSQAVIQLFNEYCSRKYCLNCAIGNQILKPS